MVAPSKEPTSPPRHISWAMAWASLFLGFMCLPVILVPFLFYDPRLSAEIEWFGPLGLVSAGGTILFVFFIYLGLSRRNVLFRADVALNQLRDGAEEDRRRARANPLSLLQRIIVVVAAVGLLLLFNWLLEGVRGIPALFR